MASFSIHKPALEWVLPAFVDRCIQDSTETGRLHPCAIPAWVLTSESAHVLTVNFSIDYLETCAR